MFKPPTWRRHKVQAIREGATSPGCFYLLDGHHRWRIICENWGALNDKYTIDYKSFQNRWAALEWICRNQLNKHNLNDEQITYITGEMYKARKKSVTNEKGINQYTKLVEDQNDPQPKPKSTAEAIARELGIAEPTVKRAEKFHDGIDAIREISKEAADKVFPFTDTDNPFLHPARF